MKNIIKNFFYLAMVLYALSILLIVFGFLSGHTYLFELFALALALFGIFLLNRTQFSDIKLNKKVFYSLFILGIAIIILFRAIPYFNNSVPLGYDAGIYKYVFENGLANNDHWIINQITTEPLFLYAMHFLHNFMSSQFMLTWLLMIFCAVLGVAVYFVVSEYANKTTGLIALFLYSLSVVQFYTFTYMYYKNIVAMSFMLFSLYFLKRYEKNSKKGDLIAFIILGGLLGAIHRSTFYIYGLSYFFYVFLSPIKQGKYDFQRLKINFISGVLILAIALMFYIGRYFESITMMFGPVLQGFINPGKVAGTFVSFSIFNLSILPYIPLVFLGLFYFIRKKDFNILIMWFIINSVIVYFQFFFFGRFTITLDLVFIILAAFGFSIIISNKRVLGIGIMLVLLISAGVLVYHQANDAKPRISQSELKTISYLNHTESNAFVMATSSPYSPWILGYSYRRTIAPGLFDYDNSTPKQWLAFWNANNLSVMKTFMSNYPKPIYVYIGADQKDSLSQYNECFTLYYALRGKIYKYIC